VDERALSGAYGPFASRAAFRSTLRQLASENRLCWRRLALERRAHGPCFARQLRRCEGVCVGEEAAASHDRRLADALAPLRIPQWPFSGAALVREAATADDRVDVHVVRDWCWLGTAHDEGELGRLLEAPPRPSFDADIARLLIRTLARRKHEVFALAHETATAHASC
jgi:DNA polymerase-3 subunit epsilon